MNIFVARCIILLAISASSLAFLVQKCSTRIPTSQIHLGVSRKSLDAPTFISSNIGHIVAAIVLTFGPGLSSAGAMESFDTIASSIVSSSSIQLSADVKILDMSLPSYGDISMAKFDADNVKGIEESLPATKSSGSRASSSKSKNSARKEIIKSLVQDEDSSQGGKVLSGFDIVDTSLPSYSESTAAKSKSVFSY